jgi:hypothetical protein
MEIPLRENIKLPFIKTLAGSVGTHFECGRRKNASQGKGKLKEKVIEPPSCDANQETFVEVPLNQIVGL